MPRSMTNKKVRLGRVLTGVGLSLSLIVACAVNPATGERQFTLISEGQEIAMGRDADPQIVASMGLYPDDALQRYLQTLGDRLAATSERPDLPWTFRVIDDPTVNAFAVPGGFIYFTRGIMAHLTSEAELVGILGHELGHVTARHSVQQMSRQQLMQVGYGIGTIFVPELATFGGVAGLGMQLLSLRHSREHEREADELGFRYMTNLDFDPRELIDVFRMLEQVGGAREGSPVPGWLQTHPDPRERQQNIAALVERSGEDFSGARVARDEYLQRLDGMVFGENPRHGFFENGTFYHPDFQFRMDFPAQWRTVNQRQAVQGISAEEDAILALTLAEQADPEAARRAFLGAEAITAGRTWDAAINGIPARWAEFTVTTQEGTLQGVVTFLSHEGSVFRMLGYAPSTAWATRQGVVVQALNSFQRLTDAGILGVTPRTIEIVRVAEPVSIEAFNTRYPSTVPGEVVRLINQIQPGETVPAGTRMKRVVGGPR